MKFIYPLILFAFLAHPAFAEEAYRPTEKCLDNINEAMKKLGTSQVEDENEISFEEFLEKSGSKFTFIYYKLEPGTQFLNITGKGLVDLKINHTTEVQGLIDIDDCDVLSAAILQEAKH